MLWLVMSLVLFVKRQSKVEYGCASNFCSIIFHYRCEEKSDNGTKSHNNLNKDKDHHDRM